MGFLYPLLNFIQPGVLWPGIAEYRPMLWAAAAGLLAGLASRADYPRRAAFGQPVFIWLLAFIFVQVLSVYYGGRGAMLEEFLFWMPYPLFVVVSVLLMPDAAALRRYVWGMMLGGMFIVFYGMYALHAGIGDAASGRASAYGSYANSNDYTYIIIQILPFLYLYSRTETSATRRGFLGLCVLAGVAGVLLSLSRGGILALVLECVLIVLLAMKGKRRLVLLPVLGLIGAVAIGYQYATRAANDGGSYTVEDSENGRIELWRAGWKMFKDKPVLGVGSRRFVEYASQYSDLSGNNRGKVSHNTYIEILSGSGILGFATFAGMLYCLLREMRRRPRHQGPPWLDATRIATLISICSILFRAIFSARQVDWSFYTLCAIGLACAALQRQIDSSVEKAPGAPDSPARGLPAARPLVGGARNG